MRIVVRTRYAADAPTLAGAGADHVVAEETEGIVRLSADVLRELGIAPGEVEVHEASLRAPAPTPPPAAPSEPPTAADTVDPEEVITFTPTSPSTCTHLGSVRPVHPSARGCEECLRIGSRWVHLRICMTCGHVGCCDSSPNRHADRHFQGTRHPVMRSVEPGERWGWCYEDEVTLQE
ncbi:MAG: UBP-type zinc finger domain-containing protein [Gemmatimonadetes bacterium]|nr:UBP-type zinc finger domain-containing protein [Gemmatimonadota bacterium]